MPRTGTTVALLLLSFVLAVTSCSKGGRVLSEHKMELLYADMFLADQWLRDHPQYRSVADTTLFFDPIFEKHNITFEDYDASLKYYVSNPEVLAEITQKASARLQKMADRINKEVERLAEIDRTNKANRVKHEFVDFESLEPRSDFYPFPDSSAVNSDSLSVRLDSLSVSLDSLSVRLDSLSAGPDSLSVSLDSVKVAPTLFSRPDSLPLRKRRAAPRKEENSMTPGLDQKTIQKNMERFIDKQHKEE